MPFTSALLQVCLTFVNILNLLVTKVFEKVQVPSKSTYLCSDFIATYEQ